MRAIVQSGFGVAADVLTVAEVAKPLAGPGEVLVQIEAAGVAKGNWLITRGLPYIARPMYGVLTPKHRVAGLQFAGTVAALGEGVDGFEIGDAVFGLHAGAFAEFVAAPVDALARVPAGISFGQAAATPISGLAALQAVRDAGRVRPGHRVLVIGASGGVGSVRGTWTPFARSGQIMSWTTRARIPQRVVQDTTSLSTWPGTGPCRDYATHSHRKVPLRLWVVRADAGRWALGARSVE